ncbi:MAG: transporter family protein [Conexibacter sp.]|nr:transporter family protein [Conexibacter sp.]
MISVRDLTVRFGGVRPIDGLTVEFSRPVCGLIGPNGAGKTTLLDVLSGFVRPESGEVALDGEILGRMSAHRRARLGLRRSFQRDAVVERLTARQNVALAQEHLGSDGVSIDELLRAVGLDPDDPRSGGVLSTRERRLVELARALVGRPMAVLYDEPGAGMSATESAQLAAFLRSVPERFGAQVILIDHDIDLVSSVCDDVAVIDFGRLVASGPCEEVLGDPRVRAAYLGTAKVPVP